MSSILPYWASTWNRLDLGWRCWTYFEIARPWSRSVSLASFDLVGQQIISLFIWDLSLLFLFLLCQGSWCPNPGYSQHFQRSSLWGFASWEFSRIAQHALWQLVLPYGWPDCYSNNWGGSRNLPCRCRLFSSDNFVFERMRPGRRCWGWRSCWMAIAQCLVDLHLHWLWIGHRMVPLEWSISIYS